jgi:hypothetical protein
LTRADFQELADIRASDAGDLLKSAHYHGAYYLAGYAVECAIKACICKLMKGDEFPDPKFAKSVWVHDLNDLVALARLAATRDARIQVDEHFEKNWLTVKDWSEGARDDLTINQRRTTDMVESVTNANHGVLPWLKTLW